MAVALLALSSNDQVAAVELSAAEFQSFNLSSFSDRLDGDGFGEIGEAQIGAA